MTLKLEVPFAILLLIVSLAVSGCGMGDMDVTMDDDHDMGVDQSLDQDEEPDIALGEPLWVDMSDDVGADTGTEPEPEPEPEPVDTCPRVRVTAGAGIPLNVRPGPNTDRAPVGTVYRGMVLPVLDTVQGQSINGNKTWYKVKTFNTNGFIAAEYAKCTTDKATKLTAPNGFYLPLKCNKTARVSQGVNGSFSHQGLYRYAWDFSIGIGVPLVAMADGVVIHTYAGTKPGSSCDGGGRSCQPYANHVVLLHGDDTTSTYRHLSKVSVEVGEFVPRGITVGLSGQTGYSTGPHAHVQRMTNCGSAFPPTAAVCQSISTKFKDVSVNGGVPRTGDTVKSGNCIDP